MPAHYFGRDVVSFNAEPGAYIGWDEGPDGRVLLEFFVALDTPFVLPDGLSGYPPPAAAPLRGKTPTTLRAAGARQSAREVLEALAGGYARSFKLELHSEPPRPDELNPGRRQLELTFELPRGAYGTLVVKRLFRG